MRFAFRLVFTLCALLCACGDSSEHTMGSHDASAPLDAGAGARDGATSDAAARDSSARDATARDGGGTPLDAGGADAAPDAAPDDAGLVDPEAGLRNVEITHPDLAPIPPATDCTVETAASIALGAGHVPACSPVTFDTRPPTHGAHYPLWADFREYDSPMPWGFLVHSMEHGAVVLAYSCPAGCPDVLAAFRAIQADRVDPLCDPTGPTLNRIVIVPDPTLDVAVTAVAWGHLYRASCLDPASLRAFVDAHYARAPEDSCSRGGDLRHACDGIDGGAP